MNVRTCRAALTGWILAISGAMGMGGPIADLGFAEAVEKSRAEGGWLLVAPFSPECMYCEMSLNETMSSATMKRWLDEGLAVIRVNIRGDFDAARALQVGQMPAYIVFKDGVEFDRVCASRLEAEEIGAWLTEVRAGKSRHRALLEEAKNITAPGLSPLRRQEIARELVALGEYALAREEFVRLWRQSLDNPRRTGGGAAWLIDDDMRGLAVLDPASRDAFRAVRDELEERLAKDKRSWWLLDDWLTLNELSLDTDRSLKWFDRVKETPDGRATIARVGHRLRSLLKDAERWADLPLVIQAPLTELRSSKRAQDGAPDVPMFDPRTGEQSGMMERIFRGECADMYVAYLAAGLDEDAGKIADLARELDASPKMIVALVERALEIGQERASQLEMLEAARKGGADVGELARRVDEALRKRS